MAMIQGVVFDMDDTLYLERDYVRSGFEHIAETAGADCGLDPAELVDFLWNGFLKGVRRNAFDRLLQAYPRVADRFQISDLVKMYRGHAPNLDLILGMEKLLRAARKSGLKLALLGDGMRFCQELKHNALGLEDLFDFSIFTDKWGQEFWKPHLRAFEEIEQLWDLNGNALVYVGDNPEKDFAGPNHLGWRTIRLRVPGQLRVDLEAHSESHKAELEVNSIHDLQKVLLDWRCGVPDHAGRDVRQTHSFENGGQIR